MGVFCYGYIEVIPFPRDNSIIVGSPWKMQVLLSLLLDYFFIIVIMGYVV